MRYCFDEAPRTGKRNLNLNKNKLEDIASNKMFHSDERAFSFIFKQILPIHNTLKKHNATSYCMCLVVPSSVEKNGVIIIM